MREAPPPPAMLTGASRGLSSAEAAARLGAVPERPARGLLDPLRARLRSSLTERLVLLLLLVGGLYAVLGQFRDAAVILAVTAAVVGVEAWIEWRAGRAVGSLSRLSAPRALVWRDRKLQALPPDRIVSGDVIQLLPGSRVPADALLIEAEDLLVDESLVTGESQPVAHRAGDAGAAELRAGTYVLRGRAAAVVTAVGVASTPGQMLSLAEGTEAQRTPLQSQVAELAKRLLVAAVAVSVIVPLTGLLRGLDLRDMLLTGLTLAFATIPTELPVLVVAVLALGALGLARRGAVVRRLAAVETLGATTLVCTDKTGTLTENRISLTAAVSAAEVILSRPTIREQAIRVKQLARLASEAPSEQDSRLADPIDAAVWNASSPGWPEPVARFNFDSARRMASALAQVDGTFLLGVKGAPEAVLVRAGWWRSESGVEPLDGDLRSRAVAVAARMTDGGGRVLAVASRAISGPVEGGPSQLERDLVLEGLLAFSDPLRSEVPGAVRELTSAGVAITMVTGDQPATAAAVARAAGLGSSTFIAAQTKAWSDRELAARVAAGCVVARARPEDKLRIVQAAAAAGQVVAVTGDGVNDAPALRAAAIGVAMGRGGSDAAREAAGIVLVDDNFATLARATAEGRRLYENLRKALRYYLAVKLGLITVLLAMALTGRPLPFAPVQIVILEIFVDLGASVAFVNQVAEADVMRRRPRDPAARLLDRAMVAGIVAGGLTLAGVTGLAYLVGLPAFGVAGARTLALVCWLAGQAALGIVLGWERQPISREGLRANPAMVLWAGGAAVFALLLLLAPPLAALLHAGPVAFPAGLLALLTAALAPFWLEAAKRWRDRRGLNGGRPAVQPPSRRSSSPPP